MNQPVRFARHQLDKTIRLRTESDTGEPAGLLLTIPAEDGEPFVVPVVDDWQPVEEKPEGELGNTLMSICPVAEIHRSRPVEAGSVKTLNGRAVSLLRPGYLYVFREQTLWREFRVNESGTLQEVDLVTARKDRSAPRVPVGKPVTDFLVPVMLQDRFELTGIRMAYSEIQWPWSYIERLEGNPSDLEKRATSVAPAWAAALHDNLSFDSGFPASGITSVPPLRPRDLGIELMLGDPSLFTPGFQAPDSGELISRLVERWSRISGNAGDSAGEIPDLSLKTEASEDILASAREHSAIVCVAIPDPMFRFRHALAQLHLALHYLDAIELSLKDRPLIHSATLIRQALFDPGVTDSGEHTETLRAAVDREKLYDILDYSDRQKVLEEITVHLGTLENLVNSSDFDAVCGDYLHHEGLGSCEVFVLQGDLLDLIQQLPGVLAAHGLEPPEVLSRLLRQGLEKNFLIDALADSERPGSRFSDMAGLLKRLASKQDSLTEEHLDKLGLSSIAVLAYQLKQEEGNAETTDYGQVSLFASTAGSVAGMVQTALSGWSSAVLKVAERLRESGEVSAVRLERVFASVREAAHIADPDLGGELQVMLRGSVDLTRYSIVGVHGNGLSFGLTDADRQSEVLTRRDDYLFADRTDASGKRVASTSPARLMDESGEVLVKVAGHTWVFVLPVDHPAALKFSALKFDWANKAKALADAPGLSRVLVGLAVYNLSSELWSWAHSEPACNGLLFVKSLGAILDLNAAIMKLYVVISDIGDNFVSKVILRPIFEVKSLPVIGSFIQKRLLKVGASSIVHTMSLVNFLAAGVTVGISLWDYRNSISRGDLDSAFGHGLAVAGGSVFLASTLLSGVLAIPGWGWALLGLGLVLGGSVFANIAADSETERVLKQGPLGIGPPHAGLPANDATYYSQLLSQFSPVTVSAKRYGELDDAERAVFAGHNPSPDDYRITVTSPLISRFKSGQPVRAQANSRASQKTRNLRLGVQELEYARTTAETAAGQVEQYSLIRSTPLKRIITWVTSPGDHSVHFLVERNLTGGETRSFGYREHRFITLRLVLQARIESEVGEFMFPVPVLEGYEPFDADRHEVMPAKTRHLLDPFKNAPAPYWLVREVAV